MLRKWLGGLRGPIVGDITGSSLAQGGRGGAGNLSMAVFGLSSCKVLYYNEVSLWV